MRMNTKRAFEAWQNGKAYRAPGRNGSPIHTCGGIIYSYNTPIAKFSEASDGCIIVNMEKYSVTTSTQQGGLLSLAIMNNLRIVKCMTRQQFDATSYAGIDN